MVWGMCSWSDVGPLICLDKTLADDTYASWMISCIPLCPLCIPTDLGNSSRTVQHPKHSELLQSGFKNTLLSLNTSPGTKLPRHEHYWAYLGCLTMCCSEETSTPLHSYGFMDSPAGCMVSIPPSTTSDISQVHATSCCSTSAYSQGPYTILGSCTSFSGSSVYVMKLHKLNSHS